MSKKKRINAKAPAYLAGDNELLPFSYFSKRIRDSAPFQNDKRGANRALSETLDFMVKTEMLKVYPVDTLRKRFGEDLGNRTVNTVVYIRGIGF